MTGDEARPVRGAGTDGVALVVAQGHRAAALVPAGRRVSAPGRTTQAARRQLMRSVTAEVPQPRQSADRAARRDAVLHLLEMSRRRRRALRV